MSSNLGAVRGQISPTQQALRNEDIMASLRALISEKCYDDAIALAGQDPHWTYRYLVSTLLTEEHFNAVEAERVAGLMKDEWYEPQQSLAYKSVVEALVQHEPFEVNVVTAVRVAGRIQNVLEKLLAYRVIITALLAREPFDENNVRKAKQVAELMGKNEYQEDAYREIAAARARIR